MKRTVWLKEKDKHQVGWWLILSVSFLLLLSSSVVAQDFSLSINGPETVIPGSVESYSFQVLISDIPIFSFPLQATITLPSGEVIDANISDSLQGYKSTSVNFSQEGIYSITATVTIGGTTQTSTLPIYATFPEPEFSLVIQDINETSISGSIQTDTFENYSLSTIITNQEEFLCEVSCLEVSCSFSCPGTFEPTTTGFLQVSLDDSSSQTFFSVLSFAQKSTLISNLSSLDFVAGENNSFSFDTNYSVQVRAVDQNTSQVYLPVQTEGSYVFTQLVEGSYVLEVFTQVNGSYVFDSYAFEVSPSPNVLSLDLVKNSLVYAPQEDSLYFKSKINIEEADFSKPVLIQENNFIQTLYVVRDKSLIRLKNIDGFYVVPVELLSSVIEIEAKLSGSPFNPTSFLPESKPAIQESSLFTSRAFSVLGDSNQRYRYEIPSVSSVSYVWDVVDNNLLTSYAYTQNKSLIVYTESKQIIVLDSNFSKNETKELRNMLFTSKPLEFESNTDIALPFTSSFSILAAKAISKEGLSQSIGFEDGVLDTSNLDEFEYVLEFVLEKNNKTGLFRVPIHFVPNDVLSISQPRDLTVYAGEEASFSFIISNKLEQTVLLDVLFNQDLVVLSDQEAELLDNNQNGILDTGILIPDSQLIVSASVQVPEEYEPGTIIPLTFKFLRNGEEFIRTVSLIVEKESFEKGKKLNYFDIDVFDISYIDETVIVKVRNNNLVDELVVLDVQITTDEHRYQKTFPLQVPADEVVEYEIPVLGEKIFVSADVYFENGLQDLFPENNMRSLVYDDAWLDLSRLHRVELLVTEKSGMYQDIFNLRSLVSLPSGINIDSLRTITSTYADGSFSYVDVPFEVLSYDEELNEAQIMFGVPQVRPHSQKNIYLYADQDVVLEEFLPIKQVVDNWDYEIIIDNRDDRVSTIGSWFDSVNTRGYYGLDYLYDLNLGKGDKFVVVEPNLVDSSYELYVHFPYASSFASNVPVTILHSEGSDQVEINQRVVSKEWKYLGLYSFDKNSQITLGTQGTDGFVVFDAIKLIPVSQYIQNSLSQSYDEFIGLPDQVESNQSLDNQTNVSIPINESNVTINDSLGFNQTLNESNISISINETNISTNISINSSSNVSVNGSNNVSVQPAVLINSPQINQTYEGSVLFLDALAFSNETYNWSVLQENGSVLDQGILNQSLNTSINISLPNNALTNFTFEIVSQNGSVLEQVPFSMVVSVLQNLSFEVISYQGDSNQTNSEIVILTSLGVGIESVRYSCDATSWSTNQTYETVLRNVSLFNQEWGCTNTSGLKTLFAEFSNGFEFTILNDSITLIANNSILPVTNLSNESNSTFEVNITLNESENNSLLLRLTGSVEMNTSSSIDIPLSSFTNYSNLTFLSVDLYDPLLFNTSYQEQITLTSFSLEGSDKVEYVFRMENGTYLSLELQVTVIDMYEEYTSLHEQSTVVIGEPVVWTLSSSKKDILLPVDASQILLMYENGTPVQNNSLNVSYENTSLSLEEFEEIKNIEKREKELKELIDKRANENALNKAILYFNQIEKQNRLEELEEEKENLGLAKGKDIVVSRKKDSQEPVVITYKTPAPQKQEQKRGLNKQIRIYSDVSMHYYDVAASTSIDESTFKPRMYHYIDGVKVDVTDNPTYQVTYLDNNNNGLFDTIEWVVPHLSDQYFEVGVASINTNKSTYHPNEVAKLTAVVLDTSGYLVREAWVQVNITSPNNTTYVFSTANDIIEIEKGIYEFEFSNTSVTGTYILSVQAIGDDVNNTLVSSFEVASYYPFDIIRSVPSTIDPWVQNLISNITVNFHTSDTVVTLVERLPPEFLLVSVDGASISRLENVTLLTWMGIQDGDSVRYVAQAPKYTPDLYELGGAYINYAGGTYNEARPWYLAIDPLITAQKTCNVITSSGSDVGDNTANCSQIETSDNVRPAGGDNALESYEAPGGSITTAVLTVGFDDNTPDASNITDTELQVEWFVEDTGGVCLLEVNNGSGWNTIDTTCQGSEATDIYDVGAYIGTGAAANAFQFRITYSANSNGGNRDDLLYVDVVDLVVNYTVAPQYNTWSMNVSNSANIRRGEQVLAYAFWNYSDGIVESYLEHDGTSTVTNYSITPSNDWTNYTLNTSNLTEFNRVGVVNLNTIYARDLDVFNQTAPALNFKIYDDSNVTAYTISQTTVNQSQLSYFSCRVLDYHLNSAIQDYTVRFYRDGLFQQGIKTNATGWATYSFSRSIPGTYNLNCNITDSGYYYAQIGNNSQSTSVTVLDSSSPSVVLHAPADNTQDIDGNLFLYYNVTDTYSGLENCSIYINGSFNISNTTAISEVATNNISISLPNGTYSWQVGCYDDSANNNFALSSARTLIVAPDTTPPAVVHIAPPNAATTFENITFSFNITDTLSAPDSCTLILDGINNQTNSSMNNGDTVYFDVFDMANGIHTWRVNCTDTSGNVNLTSLWTFTVGTDMDPPAITIINPLNNTVDTDDYVPVTFTAVDFLSDITNCSLYINGTLNQTNTSINESQTQLFVLNLLPQSTYYHQIECYDDSVNENSILTDPYYFTVNYDFDDPVVTLDLPANLYQDIDGDITFYYNVSDETGISQCRLLINGSVNQTDNTITLDISQNFSVSSIPDGDYNWTVSCTDTSDSTNVDTAAVRNFSVGPDTIGPSITLFAPSNNSVDSDGNIVFTYRVEDVTSGVDQCVLFIDDVADQTDTSITEGATQQFSKTLPNGVYYYQINCTDDSPGANTAISENRTFTVSISFASNYTMNTSATSYSLGTLIAPGGLFLDQGGSPISSANAYAYVVRNLGADNQTLSWFNTSFLRRVEFDVDNSLSNAQEDIPVNITLNTATLISDGVLNSDCSDLRFADQETTEIPYFFYDGDAGCNSAASKILLQVPRLWGSYTHAFGAYINNSAATYSQDRTNFPVVDNFEHEDTFSSGYWSTSFSDAADEWSQTGTQSFDGSNASESTINCNNPCASGGGRSSQFSKTISLSETSTLYWNWRKSGGALTFYVDGTLTDTQGTTNSWTSGSASIPAGTHTILWEFEVTTQSNVAGYVDQIYIVANDTSQSSSQTTQSEYVATLSSQTTDVDGEAVFSWDSTGSSLGNYSFTGHALKGAFWGDRGYAFFELVPDTKNPTYSSWGMNVSNGASVLRTDDVLAYSYWLDDVRLSEAYLNHNGTGVNVQYPITPFGGNREDWANYTLDFSNTTEFPSLGDVKLYVEANDTAGNSNETSPAFTVYIYSTSQIASLSVNDTAVDEGTNFTLTCRVQDEFDSSFISGYNTSFYFNGVLQGYALTNASGHASYSIQTSAPGTNIATECRIGNQPSMYYFSGTPNSSSTNINVTDVIPPEVGLYTLVNNSIRTTPTHALSYLVNDTGTLDKCYLYGNWGSGWGLKKTDNSPDKGGFPNVNYFGAITFESGIYNWYVNCTDIAGNSDVSPTWLFNITLTKPNVDILDPLSTNLYSPNDYNVTYKVQLPDPLVGIDNCSLFVNDLFNQSQAGPVAKNTNYTFDIGTVSYGRHKLNVSCAANNTQSNFDVKYLHILNISLINPANNTQVDRDGLLVTSDVITLQAQETSDVSNIGLYFAANNTDPAFASMLDLVLGSNTTNGTGTTSLYFNPNSSLYAGSYTWWSYFLNWTANKSNDLRTFSILGSSDGLFESAVLRPASYYTYYEFIEVSSYIQSVGVENYSELNNSYGGNVFADFYAPRNNTLMYTLPLVFNGTTWQASFNSSIIPVHGTWSVNLSHNYTSNYMFENTSYARTFFLNLTGYGIPSITLNEPVNDSTLFFDNPVVNNTNITFNWTIFDSLDYSVLCNLTINGLVNQSNITSYNASPTTVNVSFSSGGFYYWNVTCSDYANVNSSETRVFKIVPPDSTLQVYNYTVTGGNATVFERVNFTANYSNFYNESITDSCVINFSDGVNGSMLFNVTTQLFEYNRTMNVGGWISWNVTCNNTYYDNITSANKQLYVQRAKIDILSPVNYTLDRDQTTADPDTVLISGQLSALVAGMTIDFYVSRLDPDAGEVYYLGSNTTNSSGGVEYNFNPNSSIYAGNYSVYANGTVADTNITQWTTIMGSLSIILSDGNDYPLDEYQRNQTVQLRFNITSVGSENDSYLNTNHINDSTQARFITEDGSQTKTTDLSYVGASIYNGSIFMNTSDALGLWNVSANASSKYFYENRSTQVRQFNLTKINTTLDAWDQYDSQGGYVPAYVGEDISFFANYTDYLGGYIGLSSCNFSYSDGDSDIATPNSTLQLHVVSNKQFFAPGYYSWNVTCTNSLYEEQIIYDSIRIYPRTNASARKTFTSVLADTMEIALNLTNYASYADLIEGYDFIHYTEYSDYNYSYGPNETNAINSGEYVGNATKFNITTASGATSSITYYLNGTGDYNTSDLFIVGV